METMPWSKTLCARNGYILLTYWLCVPWNSKTSQAVAKATGFPPQPDGKALLEDNTYLYRHKYREVKPMSNLNTHPY